MEENNILWLKNIKQKKIYYVELDPFFNLMYHYTSFVQNPLSWVFFGSKIYYWVYWITTKLRKQKNK